MSEIIEQVSDRASSLALITSDGNMDRVMKMAEMMAGSRVTVPKHLQGNVGDCAAIVIQATNWGMNPFAVAQKTHLVNGVLGYEAQLINAVIKSSNAIKGAFLYEYKDEGGTAPNAFVTCRVGAVLNGQEEVTWGEWVASASISTKNSPLWKTNVKQQMGYLQVKNWSRLYCPEAILGVSTEEELEDIAEVDVTPQGETLKKEPAPNVYLTDDDFNRVLVKNKGRIETGEKSAEDLIIWQDSKKPQALMTDDQKDEVRSWANTKVQEAELVADTDSFLADYEENEVQNATA
ncbi:MAG: recombinase RecT [Methylophilales bacterium]|nr:recombinase RecT [Methylophilales bacterium]